MDRQYPDYPQYDHRRPWTYHAASPAGPLSSMYSAATPSRPEPAARRHSERWTGPRAIKRSIPHNGATCQNSLCDSPSVAPDERLCPGPKGLNICSRCYKRFKVERRHAMEDQRAVTDSWRRPKQRRSMSQTAPLEPARRPETVRTNTYGSGQSAYDPPTPAPPQQANWGADQPAEEQVTEKVVPIFESQDRGSKKPSSPLITPVPPSDMSRSLHSVSSVSLEPQDRRTSRSPQKHRSRRGREPRRNTRASYARDPSTYDEAEYYKYGRMEEGDGRHNRRCGCCAFWSRRRKCVVFGGTAVSIIILIIIIALAVTLTQKGGFKYVPSTAQVNNTVAFDEGGATRKSVNDTSIGVGKGTDKYTYYQGKESNFPSSDKWVTFEDMWEANLDTFKYSCGWLERGDDNTPEMIQDMHDAIQDRANASLVDQRIILATVIQETNGCPLVEHTVSSGGTRNPGLMQSHNGHQYDAKHSRESILLMIQDGTQGTDAGWGLVDNLNLYGNPYKAMRGYNSGYIPNSGDLSEKAGATACYVSDMANRLTGWVRAETQCPDDMEG
ncbi:hypothetical protein Q7P37_007401 [Cladosporium fusiforme]